MLNKILLVEDEKRMQEIIKDYFEVKKCEVVCASDGIEALEILESESFDLVLLDIMMPKLGGFSVCKKIRKNNMANSLNNSDIPIILITAKSDEEDNLYGYQIGADDLNALNKDVSNLADLNSEISYLTLDFSKEMFAKSYLYDENGKMMAKSRDLLKSGNEEIGKSKIDHCYINRYIDLDKCLSENEKIEFFKSYSHESNENTSQQYLIKGQGYINGTEIIPEVIDIYKCDKKETCGKVNYDYIHTLDINNHKYYLSLKADYYPWEDILPKAIPLYLISFIMVLAMAIILSKGLYRTYEKQEALEKNRRELTSAIAHELKTPLGIIRTYGEGLKEKIAEDKKDYYLDVIIDETYKMDKMVLEMLDLSKLEAKAYELKKEEFYINNLIEEIIKKNEKLFNDKNICVKYTSDKKYNINADYYRIEQVINNLLLNAIYHTDENKTINITLYDQKFNVENEGEHIPKDKTNLIWDAFYRIDNSRDRCERRTGIGLAIVKNILQLHNIEFSVENTSLGVKFWFKI